MISNKHMRVYFRNDLDRTYRSTIVERKTRRIVTSLDGWEPFPRHQIAAKPNGHIYAVVGATDITGPMLKVVRESLKITRQQLADALGCSQQNVEYHEKQHWPVKSVYLPKIYEQLEIDHRPAPISPLMLERLEKFLGMPQAGVARLFNAHPSTYRKWHEVPPTAHRWSDAFYRFYCVMPDLLSDEYD